MAAGASYYFHQSHLTPSLIVGLQMPAFYGAGGTTVVIRDESSRDILSDGDDALPILSARASLKWDLSQIMSMMLFIQYTRDVNQTRLVRDESGTFRTMTGENELGAALVVQARF